MSIPIDSCCLECYLSGNLKLVRPLGTEEQTMAFARRLLQIYLDTPPGTATPWVGPQVADLLQEMYGLDIDRYHQEKVDANRFVMERLETLRQKVASAPDPVLAGLQLSILGNYLDYTALKGQVSFDKLEEMLDKALEMELDEDVLAAFREDLETAETLLYLTDNAGEIGFDRVFAETIAKEYPQIQITFCVRGDIANNDATREDAIAVGVPFPVIDNGNRVAGTYLSLCSEESRAAIAGADVVIAKGMANTETMWGCGYNVYYAFLVKCERFRKLFQKPMFTPVLVREPKTAE